MSEISIQKIAERTGVSKSVVSRALGYCGGVEPEKAAAVRQAAKEMGYAPERGDAPLCGIVLPESPRYFWKTAYRSLFDVLGEAGVSARAALYPRITDTEAFFSALDAMLALSPRTLAVAAPNCPSVKEKLEAIAIHTPVLLLSERLEGKNLFYFGSDGRRDGTALARAFCAAYPDKRRMLVIDAAQSRERTDAFLAACPDLRIAFRMELPDFRAANAAVLARRIAAEVHTPFDCVYCATGALPSVCLALDKLKAAPDVVCIGYENPPGNAKFFASGRIGLTLCQNIEAQSALCAAAVIRFGERQCFPDQKYNYVDSEIVCASGTAPKP